MSLLNDIVVVDFSQFLSGPSAALRLADLGAEVIKIEKPTTGDICRQLYVSDVMLEGESTIFHAINRNKQSYAADLKDPEDLEKIKILLTRADVLMHNFRPGVMDRLGLGYEEVKKINPSIIYGEISGYGDEGPWKDLPGQDLLLQSISGLTWLSNNGGEGPTPMGVAVVDIMAGTHLAQGILSMLYRRTITNEGALVQVSMLESILDFQFEVLTSYFNDGKELPTRGNVNNAHAYIAAPYGIYKTKDGYIALAMGDVPGLGKLIGCEGLAKYSEKENWFSQRDEIKTVFALHLECEPSSYWLNILEPAGVWCAQVMNYDEMVAQDAYKMLEMELSVTTGNGLQVTTTRCPIRVDGKMLTSELGAPFLGEHNTQIEERFGLVNSMEPGG